MFQMGGPVLSIFKLRMRVPSKLIPNVISKIRRVSKIFVNESLKFVPEYSNVWLYLNYVSAFILSQASTDIFLKEKDYKRGLIIANSSEDIKMILALPAKPIAIKVGFPQI